MTAQAHDTTTPVTTVRPERRAGAGVIQLTRRNIDGLLGPRPGWCWLTRTTRIMSEILTSVQYPLVIYLTAPAARAVVTRAAASLPPGEQPRIAVRELPAIASLPEPPR